MTVADALNLVRRAHLAHLVIPRVAFVAGGSGLGDGQRCNQRNSESKTHDDVTIIAVCSESVRIGVAQQREANCYRSCRGWRGRVQTSDDLYVGHESAVRPGG